MPYGEWCEFCKAYHDSIDSYKRFIEGAKDCQYPPVVALIGQKRKVIETHEYNYMMALQEQEDK